MAHDIFISYSSHDKTIADAIVAALEQNGLRCWSAPRDIKPGADWGESITEAITGCKLILLIFSSSSNQSKRVLDEIYYAISEEKIILPFRVENLAPTGAMRLHLSSRHWLDAFQPSWKAHIDQLVNSAWDMVGRPAQPEPQPVPAAPLQQAPVIVTAPVEKPARKKLPLMWIGLGLLAALLVGAGVMALINGRGSPLAASDKTPDTAASSQTPLTAALPDASPTPGIKLITVTSAEDSGAGTLRQALIDANTGDTINFDTAVFPPDNPTRIFLKTPLTVIWQGGLTLTACNAGVILDGSEAGSDRSAGLDWTAGLKIKSDQNRILGLQVINFNGPGIILQKEAGFNTIGGERSAGSGPTGCGNLFSANGNGIYIEGSDNIITGNLVGTTADKTGEMGNRAAGISLVESASRNRIGPDNVIAFNGETEEGDIGISINSGTACNNTFTANSIFENLSGGSDIIYNLSQGAPACPHLQPPEILYADFDTGTAAGTTCSRCTVEIFSSESGDGRVFEGSVIAGKYGQFLFSAGKPFAGPFLTATSSDINVNTSQFSFPTDTPLPLVLAVEKMRQDAPLFETGFDDPNEFPVGEEEKQWYRFENGKLTILSMEHRSIAPIGGLALENFAVEFMVNLKETSPDGHCFSMIDNINTGDTDRRTISLYLHASNSVGLGYFDYSQKDRDIASIQVEAISGDKLMRFILVGDVAAAFLDGELAYAVRIPGGSDVYQNFALGGNQGVTCEFDDFKLWDLSGISALP